MNRAPLSGNVRIASGMLLILIKTKVEATLAWS
jgi:hypothetical protein